MRSTGLQSHGFDRGNVTEIDSLRRSRQKDHRIVHLKQDEDSGGAEIDGVQPVQEVELQSHQDEGEEQEEVEEAGQP